MICFPCGVLLDGQAFQSPSCLTHLASLSCIATDDFPSGVTWVVPTDELVSGFEMDAFATIEIDGRVTPPLRLL